MVRQFRVFNEKKEKKDTTTGYVCVEQCKAGTFCLNLAKFNTQPESL